MRNIDDFLEEDVGYGDITTELLIGDLNADAKIFCKQPCILAGCEEASAVFARLGCLVDILQKDGLELKKNTDVLIIHGPAAKILTGERLALNFLMRMSGIATYTKKMNDILKKKSKKENPPMVAATRKTTPGFRYYEKKAVSLGGGDTHRNRLDDMLLIKENPPRVAATRKTTPGFRYYEKKAVSLGGGDTHRNRLDDMLLIKENHISIVGSIEEALKRAKKASFSKKIEIEVSSLEDAIMAAEFGADIIMLDNMNPIDAKKAYDTIKNKSPHIIVEVSGGINEETIANYADCADIISMGAITHSVKAIDFSLDIISVKKPLG
ncbi:MAG: carboxylating nicotinate-nucleotide diphosphorylase [Thermoplasmata archaeon]